MNGSYLGATQTGGGKPLPVTSSGALDINALVGQVVDRRKYYFYDTLKLAPESSKPNASCALAPPLREIVSDAPP